MSLENIKSRIRELVTFDIETDYYDKENKEKLVSIFRDILFEDDVVVRNFLERIFSDIESHARELDLIGIPDDIETEPEEEIEDDEEVEPEPDEEGEDEGGEDVDDILDHKQFNINDYMIEKANDFC
ncbi:MAG: hypothetical protein WC260_01790 [Candidatus Pacearchaeota archaeon]